MNNDDQVANELQMMTVIDGRPENLLKYFGRPRSSAVVVGFVVVPGWQAVVH